MDPFSKPRKEETRRRIVVAQFDFQVTVSHNVRYNSSCFVSFRELVKCSAFPYDRSSGNCVHCTRAGTSVV
jgi:hypothetical protein